MLEIITEAYANYARYLLHEIQTPSWHNYVYWLIAISTVFFVIELLRPWREHQTKFRKDFWLDAFYMFFNFFLFSLIIYNAASEVAVHWFNSALAAVGIDNLVAFNIAQWPVWLQLLTLFVIRDFIQWNIHRLLHRSDWLWQFHKVHHSVEQMGFAAHLRFHWFENVVYRVIEYIPLSMIGFGISDFIVVHIFTIIWGHYNHANIKLPLGPLKYIFNNPQMHIWHHAEKLPRERRYGVNFGLTLSLWDYLFKTDYIPRDGKDIKLGFHGLKKFPSTFLGQAIYGFRKKRK